MQFPAVFSPRRSRAAARDRSTRWLRRSVQILPIILQLLFLLGSATNAPEATAQPASDIASPCRVVDLRCEYLVNPLGIDVAKPRLYWRIEDPRRGAAQTAYRVLVATRTNLLADGKADVWDSGKIESSRTTHIEYAGKSLRPRTRYHWTVIAWDAEGNPSRRAADAWWETGLLQSDAWKASFIGLYPAGADQTPSLADVKWIWYPEGNPRKSVPGCTRYFRATFDVPAGAVIASAKLFFLTDNSGVAWINGKRVGESTAWSYPSEFDVAPLLLPGSNTLAVKASNDNEGPAGLACLLHGRTADNKTIRVVTDGSWIASTTAPEGWNARDLAATADWKPAKTLAPLSGAPWSITSFKGARTPPTYMRKSFAVEKPVARARLYVTAKGSYRLHINGRRVGNDILTPDWTDYRKRILYQTYDVSDLLQKGENAIAAIVGDGWYASPLGWAGQRNCFGPYPAQLLAELHVEYADGSSQIVSTDSTWKASTGPIQYSEIYDGEFYDARLEQSGWDKAGFDESAWKPVDTVAKPDVAIESQRSPTIRITETLRPVAIASPAPGVHIVDMGQNMVGFIRLTVQGPPGTAVKMRFAEILKDDGNIYRDNLRSAQVTDTFILKGGDPEVFEPLFTYHGFRYIEVTGFPGVLTAEAIEGLVFHTDVPPSGEFTCSSDLVNKVFMNTRWGIRGNLESVPTDCPQRDERLGWMGDAQAIWSTACYEFDMAAFTAKWMRDVVDAQSPEGGFSNVSPRIIAANDGAPAWGDAGVILPWTAWRAYGDVELLRENWNAMEKWLRYIHEANPDFLWKNRRNSDYGDWVPADSETPKDVIATAYWAWDAQLMAEMARAIGKADAAKQYDELFANVKRAFNAAYVDAEGKVGNGSQTCQVLALHMNLLPIELRAKAAKVLVDDIAARNGHLSTGFLGSTYLMPVLSETGHDDVASQLLLNDTYPSWGYMVRKGATTIWERWNGDTGDPAMNSFNHYCYGAVVEWMYRYLAGIDMAPDATAFDRIVIRPHPGRGLDSARAVYRSLHGPAESGWTKSGDVFRLNVKVPPNTRAAIHVPTSDPATVTENGISPKPTEVRFVKHENGAAVYEVGAGVYRFQSTVAAP